MASIMADEAFAMAKEIGSKGSLSVFHHAKGAISVRAEGQFLDLSWSPRADEICVETLKSLLA